MRLTGTSDHRYRNERSPCDDCAQQARCFLSGIACADFSAYVQSNKVVIESRQPSRRRFAKLMRAE